ncbi:MAG TPA: aminotransferase class IV, partial [Anaerolineae bacterium]|nr:aminotransferase class IV [Anaerolineae bacterium]
LEGTSSNFFAVLDGRLRTAGEDALQGVTRGLVLAEAKEIVPIALAAIEAADLPRLSEALITSSSRDVMPVIQIDQVCVGSGEPGPITQALMAGYRARLVEASEQP